MFSPVLWDHCYIQQGLLKYRYYNTIIVDLMIEIFAEYITGSIYNMDTLERGMVHPLGRSEELPYITGMIF